MNHSALNPEKARVNILQRAHERLQHDRTELTQQVVALLIARHKLPAEDHDGRIALNLQIERLNRKIQDTNEAAQEFLQRFTGL